ncbi:hypothetical protein LOAG_12137 [Loa loa]|uniref:Lipoyl-binding domain-containing protein n=1 Tax=Loa loa TaxID=7209 RepID=A0A1I7VYM4_LOALO|nr:hypothetical protein LOAG_12137 [Loa loa]EFO16368.1 hypothetical protein LOAG_12137 [Loa loa]
MLNLLEVYDIESSEIRSAKTKEEPEEEPIALRTRGAKKKQMQVTTNETCKWTTGIPFNPPQKLNCENYEFYKILPTIDDRQPSFLYASPDLSVCIGEPVRIGEPVHNGELVRIGERIALGMRI